MRAASAGAPAGFCCGKGSASASVGSKARITVTISFLSLVSRARGLCQRALQGARIGYRTARFDFLPGENIEFLTALGRFTVRFAAAESGLDACNALIFHFCEGRTVEPKIPRFLERKLAFFSTCQERCTKLATADPEFRELSAKIIREFNDIKNDRHFLIHGMADQIRTTERISLSKFRFSKAEIAHKEAMMSLASIITLGDRAWELTKSTLAYTNPQIE
jgi:hypothetical protein